MRDIRKLYRGLASLLFSIVFFTALILAPTAEAALVGRTISTPGNLSNGLVGHWTFDGPDMKNNVRDRSGNNNNGYMVGFTSTSTAITEGKMGQGMRFDGVNDSVSSGNIIEADNIPAISVSIWAKLDIADIPAPNPVYIFSKSRSGFGQWYLWISTNEQPVFTLCNSIATCVSSASDLFVGNKDWHHYVGVYDGTGVFIYVDGIQRDSTPQSQTGLVRDRNEPVCIGGQSSDSVNCNNSHFPGIIDDARIYSRALSASEVKQLYSMGADTHQNVTAKNDLTSGLVGHWTFDGPDMKNNVRDRSGNNNNGYMVGFTSTSSAVTEGKVGQGMRFDGSNDCIKTGAIPSTLVGTGPFTASYWVLPKSTPSGTIYHWGSYIGPGGLHFGSDSNRRLTMRVNTSLVQTISEVTFTTGRWNHIVVTSDGSNYTAYLNGQSKISPVAYTAVMDTVPIYIGCRNFQNTSLDAYADVTLDDVRIYSRALSAIEIKQLYSMGADTHQNVTIKNDLSSGLVGHWTFDGPDMKNNVRDRSGNNNNGYMVGFTSTSTAVTEGKMGQGLRFDGVDDYIVISDSASLRDLPNESFTVTGWYKGPGSYSFQVVRKGLAANVGWFVSLDPARRLQFLVERATTDLYLLTSASTMFPLNSWGHFAVVYPGGDIAANVKVFSNGSMVSSFQTQTNGEGAYQSDNTAEARLMRSSGSGCLQGLLDDVRVYDRALSNNEIKQLYNMGR